MTLSYRVPQPVLEFAERALSQSRRVPAPVGLRPGEEPIVLTLDRRPSLEDIETLLAVLDENELVGVVTADLELLSANTERVIFVEPRQSKGLEFDTVIVVEPGEWCDGSDEANRLLYIALSRPTKRLIVLHHEPLPDSICEPAS